MSDPNSDKLASILTIQTPDGQSQVVKLRKDDVTILGRARGDFKLSDNEISSTHCQIHFINGHFHIFDMNSTNGTFVNQDRIIKCRLEHKDLITIGRSSILFEQVSEKTIADSGVMLVSKKIYSKDAYNDVNDIIDRQHTHKSYLKLQIHALYQDGTSDTLTFNQDELYIGRASSFGKFDQDDQISRKHLKIIITQEYNVYIEDQNSTNGIFLNDQKITGKKLVRDQDVVIIGNTQLQILLTDEVQS